MTAPSDQPLTFAAWVRREREARGWTQKALADRARIAEVTVRKAEGGRHPQPICCWRCWGPLGFRVTSTKPT